jgi:superfamily I DNA/RNA helicase
VLPPPLIDAPTGFTLFLKSPVLSDAFRMELEANNRSFMKKATTAFLEEEAMDELWSRYKDRFDLRAAFERSVEAFRRTAADIELEAVIAAESLAAAGGYESMVSTVDQLHEDDEARADLDALVTVFEGLQRSGEPVLSILDKVRVEVAS